jgi:hypothetical protein
MLSFAGSLRVFVAPEACDMRKGFNGLHALVTERLAEDPRQGALFVFTNRRRTRLKLLFFDGTGLWVSAARTRSLRLSARSHPGRLGHGARPCAASTASSVNVVAPLLRHLCSGFEAGRAGDGQRNAQLNIADYFNPAT